MPSARRTFRAGLQVVRRSLRDHPVVQWFVVPVLFMAGLLVLFFAAATPLPPSMYLPVVLAFLAMSSGAIGAALLFEHLLYRATGVQLLFARRDYEFE